MVRIVGMKTMHLFAGAGGGLLADRILGHWPVIAVEWDAYCCEVLRERAADGWFPGLRVWEGDVRMFDPSEYAGVVDCIAAGFPCQDVSFAGRRAGLGEGTRSGLYREVLRIAGIVRPRYLFLENVAGILANGLLGAVLGDLAARGYDARWTCLPASAVGAPHYRDRWWCLAERADADGEGELQSQGGEQEQWGRFGDMGTEGWGSRGERRGGDGADAECERLEREQQGWAEAAAADGSWERGHPGWWGVEPGVGRVADGVAYRAHRLKALGGGEVPLQAAAAWLILGGPVGDWEDDMGRLEELERWR